MTVINKFYSTNVECTTKYINLVLSSFDCASYREPFQVSAIYTKVSSVDQWQLRDLATMI